MRKVLCLLIAMLFMFCAAQAEEYFGTQMDDLYYHINLNCGGADGMVPITAQAAADSGKYPCPVCIQDDTEWAAGIAAIARGNTIIVRIADSLLDEAEPEDVFTHSLTGAYQIAEAPARLAECLHGDRYNGFLQEIRSGDAHAIAHVPAVLPRDANDRSTLIMNRRHIGNAWYIAFRPEDAIGDHWNMYWRINGYNIDVESDSLTISITQQTPTEEYAIAALQFSDPAAFSGQYDGCQIDVFADAGSDVHANAAVITQHFANAAFLENCTLFIGDRVRIPINGYMSGTDGIFCCTLTQAEYEYLKSGAKARVHAPTPLERAEFCSQRYHSVITETETMGIIDEYGTFVVPPIYKSASSPAIMLPPSTSPVPFFCRDEYDGLTILDGETLDVIAQYVATDGYMNVAYLNPAVFLTGDGRGLRILSLETGDPLFNVPYDMHGNYVDGIIGVDAEYRCMADGMPNRLVLRSEDGDRLIANTGEAISDAYLRITPLIWKDKRGAFLVEMWDSVDEEHQKAQSFFADEYFVRGEALTAPSIYIGWRCGLMDQDGKIIAPIEYDSIEVTDDLEIILGGTETVTIG